MRFEKTQKFSKQNPFIEGVTTIIMEFNSVIKKRASIREYSEKKPPMEIVIEAIESANLAPSPGNLAILRYVIVEDLQQIKKISEACQQPFVERAKILIVICSDSSNAKIMYDKRTEKYIYQHAGASIENLLLKITDLGLASCWVGAFSEYTIKNTLKIPESITIEAVLPIGYQSKTSQTTQRRKHELDNRLFFAKYGEKKRVGFAKVRREDI